MNIIMENISKRSLRSKLILSSILCLILPSLIAVSVTSYITKGLLEERAISNTRHSLETADLYLSNLLDNVIYISNYIQFDSEINTILKQYWNDQQVNKTTTVKVSDQAKITKKLEGITFLLDKIFITVLTPGHTYYSNYSYSEYDPNLFFDEPWFNKLNELKAYETYWLGAQKNYIRSDQERNPYVLTVARSMKSFSPSPYGYMVVSIHENEVKQVLQKFPKEEQIMLIDSKGTILSNKDANQIGKTFPQMDQLSLSKEDAKKIKVGDEDYFLVNHKLSHSDWYLVSLTPYKDAVEKISSIQKIDFAVQILFFSLFLLILIYLVNQLTKPVMNLGQTAKEIEKGNLSIRSGIRGPSEIGKLGQSFDQMLDRIQEMVRQVTFEQTKKRKAELEMLQAQINPHFLFNVLNSIRLRILLKGDEDNAELIQSLSALLRMTINRNNEFIPLREEVDIVVNYIKLMNFRHKDQLDYEVDLATEIIMHEVPRFFIQPFIENAYLHGFNQGKGKVKIKAWRWNEYLLVCIEDNGAGMSADQCNAILQELNEGSESEPTQRKITFSGIGIKNVHERMRLIYGDSFKLAINSTRDEGTQILLYIPMAETRSLAHV